MAQALDGKALAKRMEQALQKRVAALQATYGKAPGLVVILVGTDPASEVYVKRKHAACKRVGIASRNIRLESASEDELVGIIEKLNKDADVNGILVQLPLPKGITKSRVLQSIVPYKDVDAFHAENIGHALIGDERLAPCTPQGILHLLDEAGIRTKGADVCIINHSNIVGKPLAAMLMNRGATVSVCHKDTKDVGRYTKHADVIVTGTGGHRPLHAADIKKGAVVVDVSMVRDADGNLHGDAMEDVWDKAAWVTPVPGGVGPMTIAVLLENTVRSFETKMGVAS